MIDEKSCICHIHKSGGLRKEMMMVSGKSRTTPKSTETERQCTYVEWRKNQAWLCGDHEHDERNQVGKRVIKML